MRYGWQPYVPVAAKRRMAEGELLKLRKNGQSFQPVAIEGRKIATTFWGKAWCENLESYSDFENRLPRGRTYVRKGCVCHLEIAKGRIHALVIGSELYTVTIGIEPLPEKTWEEIKKRCTGKIASLLDLLGGKLAEGVMEVVTDRKLGLFPKPAEISMDCSCPDWATMCKHVAAVLYGVGSRLDEHPELLFALRGVNHEELVSATVEEAVARVVTGGSRRRIVAEEISDVFGIELDSTIAPEPAPRSPERSAEKTKARSATKDEAALPAPAKPASPEPLRSGASSGSGPVPKAVSRKTLAGPVAKDGKSPKSPSQAFPERITGPQVRELRMRLGLTGGDFARLLGVSGGAVSLWEKSDTALNIHEKSREALKKAWEKARRRGLGSPS
jgi:uncharacterized Zn finger protein/DNA-binding transcriptional regulator YiaG